MIVSIPVMSRNVSLKVPMYTPSTTVDLLDKDRTVIARVTIIQGCSLWLPMPPAAAYLRVEAEASVSDKATKIEVSWF